MSEGLKNETSILQTNWSKLKDTGGDEKELVDYIKFLTGVTESTKKSQVTFGSNLMQKMRGRKEYKKKDYSAAFE